MYYTSEEENYRKYGIVILEVYDETLRTIVYLYRKPTPSERKEIVLNYIIDNIFNFSCTLGEDKNIDHLGDHIVRSAGSSAVSDFTLNNNSGVL